MYTVDRWFCIALFAVCLAIGLAACGSGSAPSPNPPDIPGPGPGDPPDEPSDPPGEQPGDDPVSVPELSRISLPETHPRLWFTSEDKLARARDWYAANALDLGDRITEEGNDGSAEALDFCFDYLMTGNADHARIAIDWLMTFHIDRLHEEKVISYDDARWHMERALLIYDWCHDEMNDTEMADRIDTFNEIMLTLLAKPWGHDPMPANNYFQGYLRNAIEWVITSAHENPEVDALWEGYVEHRLENVLLPYFQYGGGRSGTSGEGGQYGVYLPDYALVPFASLKAYDNTNGTLDIFERTPYYTLHLFQVLNAVSPSPTFGNLEGEPRYQLFPYGDDEKFRRFSLAESYANVALVFANLWPERAIGRYARHYLEMIGGGARHYLRALDDESHGGEYWSSMPLDFFAADSGHFFARNSWEDAPEDDAAMTVMHFQGGQVEGVGHYHRDAMNLQLWRGSRAGGYYLTRETTSYGDCLLGHEDKIADGRETLFHNGVSFEGLGQLYWHDPGGPRLRHDTDNRYDRRDSPDALPSVERLISNEHFAYITGDYTGAYRAANGENPPRYDHLPFVETVQREVIFLRELEAVVVLDRIDVGDWLDHETGEPIKDAANINKLVTWHFGEEPIRDGDRFLADYGDGELEQHLAAHVLTGGEYNIVDETLYDRDVKNPPCDKQEPNVGQYRLEVYPDSDADGKSLVITVLHGADNAAAASAFTARIVEESDVEFVVELTHADRGRAFLHLPKSGSAEGRFAWSPDPEATEANAEIVISLADRREYMYVNNNGPVWTTSGTGTIASTDKTLVGGFDDSGLLVLQQLKPETNFDTTSYRVPLGVRHHRLLRLKPDTYRLDVVIEGDEFVITIERGGGELVVDDRFVLEFQLDETGIITPVTAPVGLEPAPDSGV